MIRSLSFSLFLVVILGLVFTACAPQTASPAPATSSAPAPAASSATAKPTAPVSPTAAAPSPVANQKVWNLKFHHEQTNVGNYHLLGHLPWTQDVEKATSGRVKIDIYPASTIMKTQNALDGVRTGIVDIAWIFTGYFPGVFDATEVIDLPFIGNSLSAKPFSQTAWALYNKYPEIAAETKDFKVLTIWTSDSYYLLTSKKQVKTLEDLKGLKLRAPGGPPTEMTKTLGAVPMLLGMPDVYLNVQKGVVDGLWAPSNGTLDYRLYEVGKYYTWVPTFFVPYMLIMNKDTWNEMPKDVQDAIMSVSGEKQAIRYAVDVYDRSRTEIPAVVKKAGFEMVDYTVPDAEYNRWTALAAKPISDAWVKKMQAKGVKNAQEILDTTLSLLKQYTK